MTQIVRQAVTLPLSVTSFVGRREAAASVKRALGSSRLVTLTGVGGVGKTRLAVHVAEAVRRGFPDGVFFIELANINEPAAVPHAVAAGLNLQKVAVKNVETALVEFLRDRRALIVLDNCEHLLVACEHLVTSLLRDAANLRVIVTSRQPLNISGEQVWQVSPLMVPGELEPHREFASHSIVRGADAMALFVDRAAAVVPGFVLNNENASLVAQLCTRLDGIPLAIELAAVRLRMLSPQDLLDRLEDRFHLLSEGNRGALPRHQTLEAAVSWSHDLCTELERSVWARCSVFAGDFELSAAEEVCVGDGVEAVEILPAIAGLVDKSILVRAADRGGLARYRMLETIRQFGKDRLADLGDGVEFGRRHRDYYLALADQSDSDSCGGHQLEWVDRLRAERTNLWAALDYCLSDPDEVEAGLHMAGSLWFYWVACGFVRDGRHWLDRVLTLSTERSSYRARALWVKAWIAILQGDDLAGAAALQECQSLAAELGDAVALIHVIRLTGLARTFEEDPAGAGLLLDRALESFRGAQEWTAPALITFSHGALAAIMVGETDRAMELAQECQDICHHSDERWVMSWVTWVLGLTSWIVGDTASATARLRQALLEKSEFKDELGMTFCVELLAWVASLEHDHQRAGVLFGAADTMWGSIGTPLFGYERLIAWSEACRLATSEALGSEQYAYARQSGSLMDQGGLVEFASNLRIKKDTIATRHHATRYDLTGRETQVANLVAGGKSNQEIASQLVVAKRTAETHVQNIMVKLGFTSRTQIATWVTEQHPASDR